MNSFRDVLFVFVLTIISGCLHIEPAYWGTVTNAESYKPVEGAVVHFDMTSAVIFPVAKSEWENSYEALTDSNGKYHLPMNMTGRVPLEITSGQDLKFYKAGYFPAASSDPSHYNLVKLYPIKFYLDLLYYKEGNANFGGIPYQNDKPEAFTKTVSEMQKMTSLKPDKIGIPGQFIEISGTKLSRLICKTDYSLSLDHSTPSTFGINENVCEVYDEISKGWFTIDSRGNANPTNNPYLTKYTFSDAYKGSENYVYANADAIYLPANYLYPEKTLKPQEGNIFSLAGNSDEYFTIQNSNLCYSSIYYKIGTGCIPIENISKIINIQTSKPVLLTVIKVKSSSSLGAQYMLLSRFDNNYIIHSISYNKQSALEQAGFMITAHAELTTKHKITCFDSDGGNLYIAYENGDLRKYTLDKHGVYIENINFYNYSHNILPKNIVSVRIGHSVVTNTIYITSENSKLHRLSLDGIPDSRIEIKED